MFFLLLLYSCPLPFPASTVDAFTGLLIYYCYGHSEWRSDDYGVAFRMEIRNGYICTSNNTTASAAAELMPNWPRAASSRINRADRHKDCLNT